MHYWQQTSVTLYEIWQKIINGYWIRFPIFFSLKAFSECWKYTHIGQMFCAFCHFCSLTGLCHPSFSLHQHHINECTVPLRKLILVKFIDIMKAIFSNFIFILVMWSIKGLLSIHKQSHNSSHIMFALLSQFPLITSKDSTQNECY